jgi:hypothetical protein
MLRDASVTQTQRYLNVTDEELRKGLEVSWTRRRALRLVTNGQHPVRDCHTIVTPTLEKWRARPAYAPSELRRAKTRGAISPELACDRTRVEADGAPGRIRTCDLWLRRRRSLNRLTPPQTIRPDFTASF